MYLFQIPVAVKHLAKPREGVNIQFFFYLIRIVEMVSDEPNLLIFDKSLMYLLYFFYYFQRWISGQPR